MTVINYADIKKYADKNRRQWLEERVASLQRRPPDLRGRLAQKRAQRAVAKVVSGL